MDFVEKMRLQVEKMKKDNDQREQREKDREKEIARLKTKINMYGFSKVLYGFENYTIEQFKDKVRQKIKEIQNPYHKPPYSKEELEVIEAEKRFIGWAETNLL